MTLPWKIALFLLLLAPQGRAEINWRELDLQNGCTLFRLKEPGVKRFPGEFCLFLPDGTLISSLSGKLRRLGQNQKPMWEKAAQIREPLTLSLDGKRILSVQSKLSGARGARVRSDDVVILDLDGNELHRRTSEEILQEAKRSPLRRPLVVVKANPETPAFETSHFTGVYEIPPQRKPSHPSFKAGHLIVNGVNSGFFVLSPDLKKVLYHTRFPESKDHSIHDAQVTPEGEFLFFNNVVENGLSGPPHSRVVAWNPVTKQQRFSISSTPAALFYSPVNGSVQLLPDNVLLFTHMFNGGYFRREDGSIIESFFGGTGNEKTAIPFKQVKALDHRKFLENHTGLPQGQAR